MVGKANYLNEKKTAENQRINDGFCTPNGLIFESTTRFSPKIEGRFLKIKKGLMLFFKWNLFLL